MAAFLSPRPVSLRLVPFLFLLSLLVACDGGAPPLQATLPLPQLDHGNGHIQWHGRLACADCDGIETSLSLQRSGDDRNYTLTETYLAEEEGARFVESGRWQREQNLVRLLGNGGGTRVFALLADGRLQPRDGRGRRFPPRDQDFLMPVTATNAR